MTSNVRPKPQRVRVDDPGILRLLELLKRDSQNGIYVLIRHEGRLVRVYRTLELSEVD